MIIIRAQPTRWHQSNPKYRESFRSLKRILLKLIPIYFVEMYLYKDIFFPEYGLTWLSVYHLIEVFKLKPVCSKSQQAHLHHLFFFFTSRPQMNFNYSVTDTPCYRAKTIARKTIEIYTFHINIFTENTNTHTHTQQSSRMTELNTFN